MIHSKTIKKIIKTKSEYKYSSYSQDHMTIIITPSKNMEITIMDDDIMLPIHEIIIKFKNNEPINKLKINIVTGKYHDKGEIIGDDYYVNDIEFIDFIIKCNNPVNQLIIEQKIVTSDVYSYYGRQEGILVGVLHISYNTHKYDNIKLHGNCNNITAHSKTKNKYDLVIRVDHIDQY